MAKKKEVDNLARCSNEALAAGMTYGKYMALKYEKEQAEKAKTHNSYPLPGWKVCPHCGKKFYATHGKMKYCSDICGANAHYKMQRDRIVNGREPIPPKICAVCGKEFTPPKNDSRIKYCGDGCRKQAWNALRYASKKKRGVVDGESRKRVLPAIMGHRETDWRESGAVGKAKIARNQSNGCYVRSRF